MLITDILSHGNRQHTDAYFQGQKSSCVGGWNRLFSLLGYSSSGLIQMPKSSIVWPHSNGTIVQSGSDCATVTTVYVCVCFVLVVLCVCVFSCIIWVCKSHLCVCVVLCVCISRSRGLFLWWSEQIAGHWNAAGQTLPRCDPIFRRCRPATVHGHRKRREAPIFSDICMHHFCCE